MKTETHTTCKSHFTLFASWINNISRKKIWAEVHAFIFCFGHYDFSDVRDKQSETGRKKKISSEDWEVNHYFKTEILGSVPSRQQTFTLLLSHDNEIPAQTLDIGHKRFLTGRNIRNSYIRVYIIHIIIIIIINIKVWTLWSAPSPELQLLAPTLLRSSNCPPSLWSVVVWFQRVLWLSLQVLKSVPPVFIYLIYILSLYELRNTEDRSRWPCRLRHKSAACRFLGSRVRM